MFFFECVLFFVEVLSFVLNCWINLLEGFFKILFETIAPFRSGPVRSSPGLFNR